MKSETQPAIALLHWGNLIEDFLDPIGISFDKFCQEMTGGWMFGYIDALKLAGVRTVLFCISAEVTAPTRYCHLPTGATVCVLPAPKNYHAIHNLSIKFTRAKSITTVEKVRSLLSTALSKDLAPYLATPLRLLAQELQREGCQAILCQEYEYARFDICVLLGKILPLPVFATFQGGDFQTSRLERPLRPLAMKACEGLIIATQTEIQRVQSHYRFPSQKITQIFNPLDLNLWRGGDRVNARKELGISQAAKVVIYHGRIDIHRKGLDILLAAWQEICQQRPEENLHLLLIGTGGDSQQLQEMIAAMGLSNIIWIDEYILDRGLMRNYLTAADIYTLPSRHEGFPVAPLEAMACGLPIVAAAAPGIPDILEGGEKSGGLIVPRENPTALAKGLEQLLDNQAWRNELSKRARNRVESAFSLEVVGQQLRQFLLRGKPA